ncbi:MAG TPA: SOS response-associated peptidase [Gammaproteobacteria bacterium]|nr:SOS response-associated peptidase [Gammaproteobacteria bacterium]
MCGRFFLDASAGDIVEHYNSPPPDLFTARYNIAPTTPVLAFGGGKFNLYRWGLIPSWAKDISIGNRMFNARAETVAEKPSFRNAYRRRRCLVPASGFYEWRLEGGCKQPYCCHIGHRLFSMAGIWELWQDADGNEIRSCAVITTDAKGNMRELHQRMPVYIAPGDYDAWLDCGDEQTAAADRLLLNTDPDYQYYAVGAAVSNSRNEGAGLIEPLDEALPDS